MDEIRIALLVINGLITLGVVRNGIVIVKQARSFNKEVNERIDFIHRIHNGGKSKAE